MPGPMKLFKNTFKKALHTKKLLEHIFYDKHVFILDCNKVKKSLNTMLKFIQNDDISGLQSYISTKSKSVWYNQHARTHFEKIIKQRCSLDPYES